MFWIGIFPDNRRFWQEVVSYPAIYNIHSTNNEHRIWWTGEWYDLYGIGKRKQWYEFTVIILTWWLLCLITENRLRNYLLKTRLEKLSWHSD